MKNNLRRLAASVLVVISVLTLFSCRPSETVPALFQRFGNGLDVLSIEGNTDIRHMSVIKGEDTVTILETFYNKSSIYVGLELRGDTLISSDPVFEFRYQDNAIGNLTHGGFLDDPQIPPTELRYAVLQPNSDNIYQLPDRFDLTFTVKELKGWKRVFEFVIPLQRSYLDVIPSRKHD